MAASRRSLAPQCPHGTIWYPRASVPGSSSHRETSQWNTAGGYKGSPGARAKGLLRFLPALPARPRRTPRSSAGLWPTPYHACLRRRLWQGPSLVAARWPAGPYHDNHAPFVSS
jgi:hypothetical protein